MIAWRVAPLVTLAACGCVAGDTTPATYPAPLVVVYVEGTAPLELDTAAAAWGELGVDVIAYDGADDRAECRSDWYETGEVDCQLSVRVRFAADLGGNRLGYAIRELNLVELRDDLSRPGLVFAHELGHVLLDTTDHLAAGERGLMAASTATVEPHVTAADRRLACDALGWCGR